MFEFQNIVISGIILFISILKTVDSFFQFNKKCENHKIVSLSYNKIYRMIYIQLSLPRISRANPNYFYKIIMDEREHIKQNEGSIPKKIINEFLKKYKGTKNHLPQMCNGLTNIHIYNENVPVETESETITLSPLSSNRHESNFPIQ